MTLKLSRDETEISSSCPHCGTGFELATAMNNEDSSGPSEGSFSICIKCANLSVFNADLSQRKATEEDLDGLEREQLGELMMARIAVAMARGLKKPEVMDHIVPKNSGD